MGAANGLARGDNGVSNKGCETGLPGAMIGVPVEELSLYLSSGRSCMFSAHRDEGFGQKDTAFELTANELAFPLLPEHALRALGTIVVHDAVVA